MNEFVGQHARYLVREPLDRFDGVDVLEGEVDLFVVVVERGLF